MEAEELLGIATALTLVCLNELVALGSVSAESLTETWRVDFAEDQLITARLGGGATLDHQGLATLYLHPVVNPDYLINIIAHEAVHIAQICRGDLIPDYRCYFWRGERFDSLAPEDPEYFAKQPWEAEARDLEPHLVNTIRSTLERYS